MRAFDSQIVKRLLVEYFNETLALQQNELLTKDQKEQLMMEIDERYSIAIIEGLNPTSVLS